MEDAANVARLSPGAQSLLDSVVKRQQDSGHERLGVNHWLVTILARHEGLAAAIVKELDANSTRRTAEQNLKDGQTGAELSVQSVCLQAIASATERGLEQATERDVAGVVLKAAGYEVTMETWTPPPPATSADDQDARPATTRSRGRTRTLDQYGRDLTQEAREGRLPPLVERTGELQLLVETLCRRTKRNPVLVGPAGVGKTAIVEGLAQRVVDGDVPPPLRDVRLVAVQTSSLVAGSSMHGELEKRVKALVSEASQEGIVLFIDEIHTIIGAGGMPGTGDIANQLKPALARGDIACIAATTDDEYRRFIEPDRALERRFQPVRVQELSPEATLAVLESQAAMLQELRGVNVPKQALQWIINFCQQSLLNRHFPDKAVDLLEQCVAYAVTQERESLEMDDVEAVAHRLVGMPTDVSERLHSLEEALEQRGVLDHDDLAAAVQRLSVTVRGLDLRAQRPSLVLLLAGEVAHESHGVAATIAETLFGSADRIVDIDFGRFQMAHSLTELIGAGPGYVGYGDTLPIHRIAQMPWCVVVCENIHACHPSVLSTWTQALRDGSINDAAGRRVFLSDAVIIMTAGVQIAARRPLGFRRVDDDADEVEAVDTAQAELERLLGQELLREVDVVCLHGAAVPGDMRAWLQSDLLPELAERYGRQGLQVVWEPAVVDWLLEQDPNLATQQDWERLIDEQVTPKLINYVDDASAEGEVKLRLSVDEGALVVSKERT